MIDDNPSIRKRHSIAKSIQSTERSTRPLKTTTVSVVPILVTLITIYPLFNIENLLHAFLIATFLLIATAGVVRSVRHKFRPMVFIFYLFVLCWLGIPIPWQLLDGRAVWGDFYLFKDTSLVTRGLTFQLAILIAFFIGDITGHTRSLRKHGQILTREKNVRTSFTWILTILLIMVTPLAIAYQGGVSSLFITRGQRSDALSMQNSSFEVSEGALQGFIKILPGCISLALAILSIYMIRQRKERNRNAITPEHLMLALSLLGCALFLNPLSNTRFTAIAALGALALATFLPRSALAGQFIAPISILGLVILYPLANYFRAGTQTRSVVEFQSNFTTGDFDGFQQTLNSFYFVESQGFAFGRYVLGGIFFFVPRSLWLDKPNPASIDVASARGYKFTNLSLPFPAELLINFGLIISVLIIFLMGYVWARVDSQWVRQPSAIASAYIPYLAMAQFAIIRGPIGSLAPIYLTTLLLIFICLKFAKKSSFKTGVK